MLELIKKPIRIYVHLLTIRINSIQIIISILVMHIEPYILQIILCLEVKYQLCEVHRCRPNTFVILKEHL